MVHKVFHVQWNLVTHQVFRVRMGSGWIARALRIAGNCCIFLDTRQAWWISRTRASPKIAFPGAGTQTHKHNWLNGNVQTHYRVNIISSSTPITSQNSAVPGTIFFSVSGVPNPTKSLRWNLGYFTGCLILWNRIICQGPIEHSLNFQHGLNRKVYEAGMIVRWYPMTYDHPRWRDFTMNHGDFLRADW